MTLPIASMLSIALALALFPAAAPAQVAASGTLSPTVHRDGTSPSPAPALRSRWISRFATA